MTAPDRYAPQWLDVRAAERETALDDAKWAQLAALADLAADPPTDPELMARAYRVVPYFTRREVRG